ncbi:MAG: DUF255 domain-containing protein [Rudaea sp.]
MSKFSLSTAIFALACLLAPPCSAHGENQPDGIHWLRSDTDAFVQARAQHRLVILYLEAVWCHWCHVMDEKTYGDATVRSEIANHFIPLRIDQDLRPDLSNRYRDYGWPATIIFAEDGREIAKRQGFVEPERFAKLLQAIVADPTPESKDVIDEPHAPQESALDALTRAVLIKRHATTYDKKLGGLDIGQKYLDRDSVEYAIARALQGGEGEAAMARKTLDAARALFDPVWGGVYQYSTYGDWKHPHFEKLATVQAQYLRIYALAFASFGKSDDAAAVREIRRYLIDFLQSPDGAFYVSQDADLKPGEHSNDYFALNDAQRRKRGIPRVDRHVYALQNGQIVEALATWGELSGDKESIEQAKKAADWIVSNRALPGGGFRHDENDASGPFLGDTLAMGRGFLALYRATADRAWLIKASAAADFIAANFAQPTGGFVSAKSSGPIAALPQLEENISVARFANLLTRYDGDAKHAAIAESALRYLASPKIALSEITEPGILLADDEFHADPLHLTVSGAKSDSAAVELFSTLQHLPQWYKRIEWWDRAERPLPNPDVAYPPTKRAAAFVCTETRCSLPIYSSAEVLEFLKTSQAKHAAN